MTFPGDVMSTTRRTSALTALAPLAPRRLWWCRLVLPVLRILAMSSSLARLRVIHFGGWIVFGDPPGPKPPGWRPRPSMLFVSDYDGDLYEYLAAFGIAVAPGMRWSFGSAEGFPGTRPTRRFIEFVEQHRSVELLRYSAYPNATVRDVDAAFEVAARIDELRRIADADEDRFVAAYRKLLGALALAPEPMVPSFLGGLWRALWSKSTVGGLAVVMPIDAGRTREVVDAIEDLAGQTPSIFDEVGAHFARLATISIPGRSESAAESAPDHLLFSAWFDGAVDDFVGRLTTGLGPWSEAMWGGCTGYPGADDPQRLGAWIKGHRLPFSLFLGSRSTW